MRYIEGQHLKRKRSGFLVFSYCSTYFLQLKIYRCSGRKTNTCQTNWSLKGTNSRMTKLNDQIHDHLMQNFAWNTSVSRCLALHMHKGSLCLYALCLSKRFCEVSRLRNTRLKLLAAVYYQLHRAIFTKTWGYSPTGRWVYSPRAKPSVNTYHPAGGEYPPYS